ncbi:wax ester/triacylglycerol synthase domain-containing protein [Rhodococcus sp. SGAir0479]|uniref:wax ester/triacylglycerol synthase domain-containing protein n=1 Tax=Rhodococcus sp. SGAir0479 TaxID=2567884 RepID=UPI0020C75B06|nr:wax ester/triacylglycerol synthase domain-containing protein [Rhodococcus sp. SGAir0479]
MTTTPERTGRGVVRLAPQDAEFVYREGERHISNATGIYMFDTTAEAAPITGREAVEWMRARLGCSAVFTRTLRRLPWELDYPFWVPDPTLDLTQHVFVEPVDGPGWDAFRGHVSRIAGRPLDLTRPPWELHFLTGVTGIAGLPERMTVAVLRCHHSAGDGIAARDLGLQIFGRDAAHPPVPSTPDAWSLPAELVGAVRRLPAGWRAFRTGLATTGAVSKRVAAEVAAGRIAPPAPRRPATRFNNRITPDLTFDTVRFSPTDIRAVQAVVDGVTFNDVLLTTVSGGLAAYLAEKGETPAGSLAAMVPMSLRGTRPGVAQESGGDRANHLALMSVDLHTDIDDPIERLRAVTASVRAEKHRHRHPDVQAAARRVESSPAWFLAGTTRLLRFRRPPEGTVDAFNTMISNIPWTGDDLVLRNAPLVRSFGLLGIVDGVGLRHLVVSHHGDEIEISFCADTAMMPDTERYGELLRGAFRALVERANRQ